VSRGDRSRPTHERTAEERERDREERARRRGRLPEETDAEEVAPPVVDEPVQIVAPAVEAPVEHPVVAPEPLASPRSRAGGSPLARVGAVIALLGVIAAVVLLLVPLLSSSHAKTIAAPVVVKVLIPEGKTRAQIAEIAAADRLSGSYSSASARSSLLNPAHYGAPHGTRSLEGFLFPATYDMDVGEPASTLVEEQLTAFRENFTESQFARARSLHVTPYQLLTVASMVEREAQVPGDRAKIAAVIYNRLRQGIPLGIDATIYYAVEQQQGIATYTHELTEAQLRIDSPYNTRTHTGLPPTPISNPGDASIHAAAYPARVSYLYYVAAADGCGEQVFSNTLSEFETNVAAYHAAVSKSGGHPPSCTHKH
jgi:cell division protein YceG involved in septum cleavage